jgi:hypothetical protein
MLEAFGMIDSVKAGSNHCESLSLVTLKVVTPSVAFVRTLHGAGTSQVLARSQEVEATICSFE